MDFLLHLWETPWWVYDPVQTGFWGKLYRGFNLVEGGVWGLCAVFVLIRWMRFRRSFLEPGYAVAFLLFGMTDFREASSMSAMLAVEKAILLGLLILFRIRVLKRCYPQSRSWI